jgi:hypothetical protein
MVRCWEVPFCRALAKHDPYDSAEKIVEKRDKQGMKEIKEGQAS